MGYLKAVFIIAITMALSLTITMKTISTKEEAIKPATASSLDDAHFQQQPLFTTHEKNKLLPSKRVSRFLAQKQNPNAPIHCHRDSEICELNGAKNATCCNNKCMDLGYDRHNCGACKKKCKFPETCCRGQCVDTSFDKRHCGRCNNRCEVGQFCVFGMCDYA